MKKLIAILSSVFFIFSTSVKADVAFGVTANFAQIDTDGKEVELTGDAEETTKSVSEDVVIPEIFVEAINDQGWAIGLAYIPARQLGAESRTDTSPTADTETGDAGTYKADAEIKNVVQIYTDIPVGPVYVKLGFSRADIKTMEENPTGTSYNDSTVNGYTVGAGYRGEMPILMDNGFYKVEATYTDFDEFRQTDSNSDHRVIANTEVTAVKLSVGTQF